MDTANSNMCEGCPVRREFQVSIELAQEDGNDQARLDRLQELQRIALRYIDYEPRICPGPQYVEESGAYVCPQRSSINFVRILKEEELPTPKPILPHESSALEPPKPPALEEGHRPGTYL